MPLWGEDAWNHGRWGLVGGELPSTDWFQIAYDSDETDILSLAQFSSKLYAGSNTGGKIYESTDGTTWTLAYDSPETRINKLHVFGSNIYAATGPSGLIYKSSDGSTWTLAYDGPDTDILALETFGSNLYHGGDSGVIRTSTDGTTWTLAYDAGSQADTIYDLEVFSGQLYAASGDTLGLIFRSSDGTTWTLAYDSDQSVIQSLGATLSDFPDGSDTLLAGSGDQFRIYKTTDGTTWTLSYDGLGTVGDVRSLHVTAGMAYAGTELLGVLYRSSNAVDWSISYDSPAADIHVMEPFGDPPNLYLGTGNGGIVYEMDNYVEIDNIVDVVSPDGGETVTTDTYTVSFSVESPYDSAVAHWKLDETSGTRADSVGNLDLTDHNTVASAEVGTGRVGTNRAVFVSANSEYLSAANSDVINFGDEDFTFSCWIRITDKADNRIILSKWDAPSNLRQYMIDYDPSADRFRFVVSSDGTDFPLVEADSLGSPTAAAWYFIVAWHDSVANTINIQINNGTVDSTAHSGGVYQTSTEFDLGRALFGGPSTEYHNGDMDSVTVFNKVLTSAERTALWNSEQGLEYPLPDPNVVFDMEYTRNYSSNRDWSVAVDDQGIPSSGTELTGFTTWFPKFENLRAHWTLEETSGSRNDIIGSHTLTDNNTVTSAAGKVGTAAQFTRANSEYLSTTSTSSISFGDEYMVLCAWVYLDSKPGNMVIASKWKADTNNREYLLWYQSATDRFSFAVSSDGSAVTIVQADSFGSPSTGTWYFVLAAHNPVTNVIEIQVNDGTVDQTSYSGGINNGSQAFEIGRGIFGDSSTNNWDGRIDEVSLFIGGMGAPYRSAIYNSGNGLAMKRGTINGNQLDVTWNVLPIVDSTDMKVRIRARDTTASNGSWNESDDVFTLQNGPC